MMTLERLNAAQDGAIFAQGYIGDDENGVNMSRSGKPLRWVAVKGWNNDWSIYVHWADNPAEWVARQGDKVCMEEHIKKLVPCDDETFARYRL